MKNELRNRTWCHQLSLIVQTVIMSLIFWTSACATLSHGSNRIFVSYTQNRILTCKQQQQLHPTDGNHEPPACVCVGKDVWRGVGERGGGCEVCELQTPETGFIYALQGHGGRDVIINRVRVCLVVNWDGWRQCLFRNSYSVFRTSISFLRARAPNLNNTL